jgi:CDP-glycerol glycerophosphotransferase
VFYIFPVINNRIIFISYSGKQYSCNPKYIYEYLYKKYKDSLQYIWVLNKKAETDKDTPFVIVKPNSLRYFLYILTAKIVISNFDMKLYIPLRPEQKLINTWHGGGAYKKVGNDIIGSGVLPGNSYFYNKQLDILSKETFLFVSSCKKFTEVMSRSFKIPLSKFIESGMPRNDVFFTNYHEVRDFIRKKYNILPNQSILLYAPTFRGLARNGMFKNDLDIDKCLSALNNKFNADSVAFFRAHYYAQVNLSKIIDVTDYPDMQELLCATDILITDYSSTMWDFSLTMKPGFLFVPDLEDYEKERSFYTPIESWPYPFARTNDELIKIIENYDVKQAKQKIENHLTELGSFEYGTASSVIANIIEKNVVFAES